MHKDGMNKYGDHVRRCIVGGYTATLCISNDIKEKSNNDVVRLLMESYRERKQAEKISVDREKGT